MAELEDVPEVRHGFGGVVDGLTWAIGRFDNKDLAFGIALAILFVAVAILLFLHFRRHRPWVQPIRRVSAKLRILIGNTADASKRLTDADEIFRLERTIEPLWREYRKQFKADPKTGGYLNLVDPRIWFSAESLPGRGYEHWCGTWAGVFLTVGLLFTFIGLSAALLKVANIGAADSAAMKAAITGILGVSSAKFITSIAGLLAYIGFSLVTRRYQSGQQAAARELADAVQHLSLPRTPEFLLYEQNEIAREQLTRMERFTDDLAVAIDGKLEKRLQILASDFGQHLGTIQQSLPGATAEPIVAAIQSMTQTVATEFSTQVRQTAEGEINAVAERLSGVAEQLDELKKGMGGVGDNFETNIKTASDALIAAAQKMGDGVDGRSNELEEKIGQFSSKLDNIAATLARVPGSIDTALNETLKKLTRSIGDIATSVGQVPAQIDTALNDTLSKLTNAIDALVQQISEGGRSGATALSDGGEAAGKTLKISAGEAGRELKDRLSEVSGKLDEITGALGQIPENISLTLNNTLIKLTESVDVLFSRLTQGGEEGAIALISGGQEAGNTLKTSANLAGKELAAQMSQFSDKLDTIAGTFDLIPKNIDSALKETLTKLAQVPGRIDGALDHTLEKRSKVIGELMEKLNQGGKSGATALRDGGENAGRLLKESALQAGQELKGKIDEVAKTLAQIPNSIDRALKETLNGLTQGGTDGGNALREGGQQAGNNIKQATGQLEAAIKDLANRLLVVESSLQSLPGAVADQVQSLGRAGQTFEVAGQIVLDASDALRQASQPLQKTADTIQSSLTEIRQGITAATSIHQQANQSVQEALVGIKNTAEAAQRTFKTHEERFGRVDAELAKALTTLSDGVEQIAKETQSVFAEYDRHIIHAVGSLGTVAEQLQEAAEELGDSCKQLVEAR